MKKEVSENADAEPAGYEAAFNELQQILSELQDEGVGIDDLSTKVARAQQLIAYCRERLRQTEAKVLSI
jgi:exodeoxyribonuclease VII small subunit